MMTPNTNEYIRALAASGLSIIPIAEGEKKPHPILGSKHNLLKQCAAQAEVERWIAAGVTSWAVAGGKVSGNLVTLDFDEKHYEGLYDQWYAKLADDQKCLVDTCARSSTRNKGTHLRYRTETPHPTIKLARRFEWSEKEQKEMIVTTAETKAERGYALIPHSAGYTLIHGDLLNLPLVTDEMHEELIDVLRTFNEVYDEPATEYEYKPSDTPNGDRPGDRFNAQATWEEILEPHGWVQESKGRWRRPGKGAGAGISATTDYDGHPMLYVFSSSAAPFSEKKGYSKFHAYTLLNHDGDFKVAARAAALKYSQVNQSFQPLPEVTASLKDRLAAIPEGTAKADLPVILAPLIESLVEEMGPADAETFVRLNIKKRFKFTDAEIGGFVKKLRELRPPKDDDHEKEKSQANQLIEIVLAENTEFFKNEVNDAFVRVKVKEHFEVLPVKSKGFKLWATGLFYQETQGAMNSDAYQTARNVIENRCLFDGETHCIHPRVAREGDVLWYDLGDANCRAVRIDANGWTIESNPPILFRRYQHMRAQVDPVGSRDPREIFEFINIEDEDMKLLLLVWIISCFVKGFPHTAPMIFGPQGSAKTTASEILKAIIDPSVMKTTRLPHDVKEVTQILSHAWLTIFDNVSPEKFFENTSDLLCTVITGGGVSKRELYSDDDDVIYDLQRIVGLNGINLVASKPDLLDRSILIELARIPEEKRKPANEVNTLFNEKLPGILGGIFDTLVKAIRIKPTLTFSQGLPRMADFTVWGAAIAVALGYTQDQFLSAYTNNIKRQNDSVVSDSLVASLVCDLLEKCGGWQGTSTQLLEKLGEGKDGNQDEKLKKDTNFPKAANALSKQLNELKTTLTQTGCFVWQTGNSRKEWHISKTPLVGQGDLLIGSTVVDNHSTNPAAPQTSLSRNYVPTADEIAQLSDDEDTLEESDECDECDEWDVPRDSTDEEESPF